MKLDSWLIKKERKKLRKKERKKERKKRKKRRSERKDKARPRVGVYAPYFVDRKVFLFILIIGILEIDLLELLAAHC